MKDLLTWEAELLPSAKRIAAMILPHLPADGVLVDAGANTGLLSSLVLQERHDAQVILFEPVACYAAACRERFAGHFYTRIYQCALSDAPGEQTIYCHQNNLGMNSLDATHARGAAVTTEIITLATLDSFHISAIDVLKIDVEEWEGKVLRGAHDTIRHCRPVIIMEWSRGLTVAAWREKITEIEWLFAQGYQRVPYDIDSTTDLLLIPEA